MDLLCNINSYVYRCAFRYLDYVICVIHCIDVTLNIRYILWDVYHTLAE
jgi:hypothetical protein